MTMTQNGKLAIDDNDKPVMGGTSSAGTGAIINAAFDPVTRRLLVDNAGGAASIVVGTTTITSGTNTRVLYDNAGVLGEYTITGTGSVVMSNSPTFNDDITLGVAATATGSILFKGITSGTVTLSVADAAGTWTMKLPTTDGDAGQFLQTDGSGNTTWAASSAAAGGNNTEVQYNNAGALGGITNATSNGTTLTITSGRATTDFSPSSNDGAALGTTALGFADLHLATGGIINWANGEMTITETNANLLTVAGGAFAVSGAITGTSSITLGAAAGTTGSAVFAGTTSGAVTLSVADAAGTWTMKLPTTDGNANEFLQTDGSGNTTWASAATIPATTITVANEGTDATCFPVFVTAATGDLGPKSNVGLTFNSSTASLGATLMTATTSLTTAAVLASSNDSGAIGASGTAFSDLFLASGAVINFAAGNAVMTHSSGIIDVTTGDFQVSTAGTANDSVMTNAGTQTMTNKTVGAGALQLAENARVALDAVLSADGTYSGITIEGTAGATLAFGDLVYLASADSRWELTDADSVTTAGPVWIGMCVLAAANDGDPTRILLQGNIRADAAFPSLTISAPAYVGTTAGDIQVAAPTGDNDVVRIVGHAITADSLYFNPSTDWVVLVV